MRRTVLVGLLLWCAVFVLLSLAALAWRPVVDGDAATYLTVARTLAQTGRLEQDYLWHFNIPFPALTHPMVDRRPLLVVLYAAWFRFLPGDPDTGWRLFLPLVTATTCTATWLLARQAFGCVRTGWLAVAFLLLNWYQVAYACIPVTESLLQLWFCGCAWCLYRALQEPRRARWLLLAGLCAGLALLTRNQGMMCAVAVAAAAAWLAWRERSWRVLAHGVAALLVTVLLFLPWQWWAVSRCPEVNSYLGAMLFSTSITDFYSLHAKSAGRFWAQPLRELVDRYRTNAFEAFDRFRTWYAFPLIITMAAGVAVHRGHPLLHALLFSFAPGLCFALLVMPSTMAGCLGEYFFLMPLLMLFSARGLVLGCRAFCAAGGRARLAACAILLAGGGLAVAGQFVQQGREGAAWSSGKYALLAQLQDWARQTETPPPVLMTTWIAEYNWYTGRPGLLLPADATRDELVDLAQRYGVHYVLCDGRHPAGRELLAQPAADPRFVPVRRIDQGPALGGAALLFRFDRQADSGA